MEPTRRQSRIGRILLVAAFVGLPIQPADGPFTSPEDTLLAVGRRLSHSRSETELTALASHGAAIARLLEPAERTALATTYLKFQVLSPVVVHVAAPAASAPFWLHDLGFEAEPFVLANEDTSWKVFRKTFTPGLIGLGVNGLDRTPPAHYVVFVKRTDRQASEFPESGVVLDPQIAHSWKAVSAGRGVSAAHDVYRPFEIIPDELKGALLLQPAHSDRHSTLLATGRVWKTHVLSGKRPDQVTISFGADPARELVWTWTTSTSAPHSIVRIAPANSRRPCDPDWKGTRISPEITSRKVVFRGAKGPPFAERKATIVSGQVLGSANDEVPSAQPRLVIGDATSLRMPNLLNDPVVLRHRVLVDGLEPGTAYLYSLGDGTAEGWGPWRTVKTAPPRQEDVRFLYLGDAQTGLERWGRLLRTAYRRHPQIDFLIVAGDLVDRGNERTNWDHFFLRAKDVFERVPFMPCVGNHEYLDMGPRLYRAFFEMPRNGPAGVEPELVYQFECGDAFFAMLDSTLAVADAGQARRQGEWLDEALDHTHATWKIVIFHHPVYPSHPWRDTPNLREHWVPVFDRHHVDLVLQGHDHAYLRTHPMHSHRPVAGSGAGTTYVVAVSGDKFVDQAQRDYIAVGYTGLSTYQTIEIAAQERRLTYRAWTEAGQIVDELELTKGLD